ncbi:putative nucleobase-ascorbate transporter 10 [Nicotiana tomentosiformis]|uniref:putative nucleobase-ascorbate transporter 10 n=1 Tax=Nicotiana tomentosiformis TaxID=4098 RepID=UPI00051B188D
MVLCGNIDLVWRIQECKLLHWYSWTNCRISLDRHVIISILMGVSYLQSWRCFTMVFASFAASVESTGVYLASARYGSAKPVPPVISHGYWLAGITILLMQLSPMTNIIWPIGSMQPLLVLDFSNSVTLTALGQSSYWDSLFMGFSLPQYFREHHLCSGTGPLRTHSRWFNDIMSVIFMSHGTVAAIVAVFLDRTLLLVTMKLEKIMVHIGGTSLWYILKMLEVMSSINYHANLIGSSHLIS